MNQRRQANRRKQPLIAIQAFKDLQMGADLRDAPHRFKVYRIQVDECAICQKPRREHLPEDRGDER